MAKGRSLHIGVNVTNPDTTGMAAYKRLLSCIKDAEVMQKIAIESGFDPCILLPDPDGKYDHEGIPGREPVFDRVEQEISIAAKDLHAGDTFLLTFAGHGVQLPNGHDDSNDGSFDEGWMLYDYVLPDDCLRTFLAEFKEGVRVIVVADSCYSRTTTDAIEGSFWRVLQRLFSHDDGGRVIADIGVRSMPIKLLAEHFRDNLLFYQRHCGLQHVSKNDVKASIIELSACQANEQAYENKDNGFFTAALKEVLYGENGNYFTGSYNEFMDRVCTQTKGPQIPGISFLGRADDEFRKGPPFKK